MWNWSRKTEYSGKTILWRLFSYSEWDIQCSVASVMLQPFSGSIQLCGFSVMCLFISKARRVSKQKNWSRNVWRFVSLWQWLSEQWEMLQQWMWTSVYGSICRYLCYYISVWVSFLISICPGLELIVLNVKVFSQLHGFAHRMALQN